MLVRPFCLLIHSSVEPDILFPVDVSRTLSRHFHWHESALWKEDLLSSEDGAPPSRTVAVVLGGQDCILPAPEIKRYLTGKDDALDHWVSENGKLELLCEFFSSVWVCKGN